MLKKYNFFITASALALGLAALATAGIRQYDPATQDSVDVEERSGFEGRNTSPTTPPAENSIRQPARPAPTAQTPASRTQEVQQTEFPLGSALFFVKPELMNAGLNGVINEVRNMDGLDIRVLMSSEDPQMYMNMVDKMGLAGIGDGLSFSADSGAYFARMHQATSYDEVVYMPPGGTKRYYRIPGELDKFMRHVRRVQREGK